jgi:RNA polymerase sigma factor (sigma-70 family)
MGEASSMIAMMEQDRQIADVIAREQPRLRSFIRRRVANEADVEELLQEVFYELVQAYRLLKPIDFMTAWLFRVARNRITDLFRKKRPENFSDESAIDEEGEMLDLGEVLPSPDAGPETQYLRTVLLEELEHAIAELPPEQREAFVGHEIEGRSFNQMAAENGVSVNTLLSRKRYAVLRLRERLTKIHEEFQEKRGRV